MNTEANFRMDFMFLFVNSLSFMFAGLVCRNISMSLVNGDLKKGEDWNQSSDQIPPEERVYPKSKRTWWWWLTRRSVVVMVGASTLRVGGQSIKPRPTYTKGFKNGTCYFLAWQSAYFKRIEHGQTTISWQLLCSLDGPNGLLLRWSSLEGNSLL